MVTGKDVVEDEIALTGKGCMGATQYHTRMLIEVEVHVSGLPLNKNKA